MGKLSGSFLLALWLVFSAGTAFSSDFIRYGQDEAPRPRKEQAQDALVINRPPNIQGLTGLMITNTAYTQKAGHMALGVSAMGENSDDPDYSIAQGIATLTIGVTDHIELGAKGKVIATDIGSAATRKEGRGDTEVALKWRIRDQSEEALIPAIALGIGGILATGDRKKGYGEVEKQGLKFMTIVSAENEVLEQIFVGIHFEAQAVFIDQIAKDPAPPTKERYGVINAGLHFPFDASNHMQMLLEYNQVLRKDIVSLREDNYKAMSVGLRYVARYFNFTMGAQFLEKKDPTIEDTKRYIATMSVNY